MGKKGGGVRVKTLGPKGGAAKMVNPMEDLMVPPEDMVRLPPPPDRAYQIFWPIHETFSMDPSGFVTIYPSYVDSSKTLRGGRRIGAELAVDTPTVSDLSQALQLLGLRHVLQPHRGYPRDSGTASLWDNPGRVRVEPPPPGGKTKRGLLLEVAALIPTLPGRIRRLEEEARAAEEEAAAEEIRRQEQSKQRKPAGTGSTPSAAVAAAPASSNNKKKGRKKK